MVDTDLAVSLSPLALAEPSPAFFYRKMLLIRRFEERVLELFAEGHLSGTTHAYIGQEANAVGVLAHLSPRDIVVSNHRCHGHYLAVHEDADGLMAEIMGRTTGICGGKGGSQHLCRDNFYTNGVLGGTLPMTLGMALAERQKGSGARAVVFLGDGALGEGAVYESFNLASLWAVPMLFVVENNFYAQSTPTSLELAGSLAARPRAFGIQAAHRCPASVEEVYALAGEAWAYIEREGKPYCLLLDTYRFCPHSKGDDFRAADEIARWRARDPLGRVAQQLPTAERTMIEAEIEAQVAQAVARAQAAPVPTARDLGW